MFDVFKCTFFLALEPGSHGWSVSGEAQSVEALRKLLQAKCQETKEKLCLGVEMFLLEFTMKKWGLRHVKTPHYHVNNNKKKKFPLRSVASSP